jgi:hypothetical protein
VVKGLVPVARISGRSRQRRPENGQLIRFGDGHRRGDGDQQCGQGGQQPARPAHPEPAQTQPAAPGMPGDQKIGDQVAAQHEKDVNAEETPRCHTHSDVESDDGEYRKRPDAVKTGNPAHMPGLAAGLSRDGRIPRNLPALPGLAAGPDRTFLEHFVLPPAYSSLFRHPKVRANTGAGE